MLDLHLKGRLTEEQVEETAATLHEVMTKNDLLADMEARQEDDGPWFLGLSTEDGDAEDFVYFDSEEQAERVADRLMELIEGSAESEE